MTITSELLNNAIKENLINDKKNIENDLYTFCHPIISFKEKRDFAGRVINFKNLIILSFYKVFFGKKIISKLEKQLNRINKELERF